MLVLLKMVIHPCTDVVDKFSCFFLARGHLAGGRLGGGQLPVTFLRGRTIGL